MSLLKKDPIEFESREMNNTELCLEVFSDGTVLALEYVEEGADVTLSHDKPVYRGEISRELHLILVGHMAGEYHGNIQLWTDDFFIDHGEIPDELWDEIWTCLERVEV